MEITKKIYSEISAGELFDKISILEIKKNKIINNNLCLIIKKPHGGIEPPTFCLQGRRSTTELIRHVRLIHNKLLLN